MVVETLFQHDGDSAAAYGCNNVPHPPVEHRSALARGHS